MSMSGRMPVRYGWRGIRSVWMAWNPYSMDDAESAQYG